MLYIKNSSVKLVPQAVILVIVAAVYDKQGFNCIITSGNDGKHSDKSLHYQDKALDFRVHNVPMRKRPELLTALRAALGPDYDVLLEANGTPNAHVHVEFDPKPKP